MTPFQLAQKVYDDEPCARTFWEDLHAHLMHGIVLSTPECFALVRSVSHDWPEDRLKDSADHDPDGNCWMMWLAVGDITPVFSLGPPKEWVAYEIENVLRVMKYEVFRRLYRPRTLRATAHA